MIRAEVLDRIAPLEAEWDALAESLGAGPFVAPDFIAAHWSAFGAGRLTVVAVRRKGVLEAVLPLTRRGATARSITNAQSPQFGMLGAGVEIAHAVLHALTRTGISRVALSYVDRDDPLIVAMHEHALERRWLLAEHMMLRSPYVELEGTIEDYRTRLKRSFKADLRRRTRRLAEQGEVTLDMCDGTSRLDALLSESWKLESAGWKGRSGTAIASLPSAQRFYGELARRAAARGRLRLFFLRLDGRALAFLFGLEQRSVLYLLKGGFDPDSARQSPGQQLLERVIEHGYAAGLSRIELLGGDEPYKLHWTHSVHERISLQCFGPSVMRRAQWAAYAYGWPLAVRLGLDRRLAPVRDRGRAALYSVRGRRQRAG
ncbi:MAG: GNAT family N-acetyltransferase [Solirubrobacteraceae bacterium]